MIYQLLLKEDSIKAYNNSLLREEHYTKQSLEVVIVERKQSKKVPLKKYDHLTKESMQQGIDYGYGISIDDLLKQYGLVKEEN